MIRNTSSCLSIEAKWKWSILSYLFLKRIITHNMVQTIAFCHKYSCYFGCCDWFYLYGINVLIVSCVYQIISINITSHFVYKHYHICIYTLPWQIVSEICIKARSPSIIHYHLSLNKLSLLSSNGRLYGITKFKVHQFILSLVV